MRLSFSSTNLVEAVNGQLEIMRRNSGGFFHSDCQRDFRIANGISEFLMEFQNSQRDLWNSQPLSELAVKQQLVLVAQGETAEGFSLPEVISLRATIPPAENDMRPNYLTLAAVPQTTCTM
jgi:hypothetical protein